DSLPRACRDTGKPCLVVAPGGLPAEERQRYEAGGVRVLGDTQSTLEGIAAMLASPRSYPEPPLPRKTNADGASLNLTRPLTEPESLRLLSCFGIDTVTMRVCRSADEAVVASIDLGFPVVLKAATPGLAHKSDRGMVRLGLMNAEAVRAAHVAIGAPAEAVVQRQVAGGLEAIIGVTRAPGVGALLLAGLGGIHAEAFSEPCLWPLPTSRTEIERKIGTGPLGRALASACRRDASACAALVAALLALQDAALWAGARIAAIDINPLILADGRAVAVDALVVPAGATPQEA
ncbi:MAG TPA: acetate--CoA ligase family protein, partial [Stellaceae bacterium]|nr:acetate--CoA ligase family protein [Stellaceae bacterium]